MVYAVRSFRRYQQGFVIQVMGSYFGLLAAGDQLRNASENYRSVHDQWWLVRRLADGGRQTEMEAAQARQSLLDAELGYNAAESGYQRQLDEFKIFLGLPLELDVGPDPAELDVLAQKGLARPDMQLDDAVRIALAERLDYRTACDALEDASRQVRIALQNLLPVLSLSYSIGWSGYESGDQLQLDFQDNSQHWGLSLGDLFDWTPRKIGYRLVLIAYEQQERSLAEQRDRLMLDVRDNWRELERQRKAYAIQEEGVKLAERRVREATLRLGMGRATARDLLEAQDALLSARNSLTSALVNYTIQRLQFWNSIERFQVDARGMWYDNEPATAGEEQAR